MNLDSIHSVYFLGIGGIGMSALARWFNANGKTVVGYDRTATELTAALQSEGISIHFEDNIDLIPQELKSSKDGVLVVYTPAIPSNSYELAYFDNNGYVIKKRAEVLGIITQKHFTVAVAGTHGKTTTSSMIAHVLKDCGRNISAFLGGITQNYQSNLILGDPTQPQIVVVEADEFDRSFLHLEPNVAVITTTDPDHLDIYDTPEEFEQGFKDFTKKIASDGVLVLNTKVDPAIAEKSPVKIQTYGFESGDTSVSNMKFSNGYVNFDLIGKGELPGLAMSVPGIHNIENAVAAILVFKELGLSHSEITDGLSSFKGVKRRFEYHYRTEDCVYIDDYAHHPSELSSFIKSLRNLYPSKRLSVVFQPHLFSRTQDFMDGFADALSTVDELYLLPIYPARELPIEGVSSEVLLDKINLEAKHLVTKTELIQHLKNNQIEVLATVGAGDIDTVIEEVKNVVAQKAYV